MTLSTVIILLIIALVVGIPLAMGKTPEGLKSEGSQESDKGIGFYIIGVAIVGTLAALIFGFASG